MKHFLIIALLSLSAPSLTGQNNYPQRIQARSTRQITAREQALWVITQSQMDSAIATGLAYRICDSTNALLQIKTNKLEQKNILTKEINDTLQKGYRHYVSLWKRCDATLEKTEKKLKRQSRLKYIFGGTGLTAGFLLALLIL